MTVIAIDGPAASGKGTLARRLAAHYGLHHLDTGLLYRAVGLRAEEEGMDPVAAARAVTLADLAAPALREEGAAQAASRVAVIPAVREALRGLQRRFAAEPPGAVLDGRDIGTIVFPEAQVKIFLDADPNERVRRRSAETHEDQQAVAKEMAERDRRDRTRAEAPLIQAPDAEYLDSSTLTLEQVEEAVLKVVRAKTSNGKAMQS